ncbi:autotransporter-associated beta strand repeat-containing protein [Akkermansiaceae bacterium]|nr:autotransporter-associated beta strand repeat-containing protein [Akkermansiaceae bacterium]
MKPKAFLRHSILASSALFAAPLAQAATYTWSDVVNGTAVSANWSAGTNWTAAPVSAADTTLSFGMTYGSNSTAETNTLTNDVANPFQLNVLTFAGNTPGAANGTNVATVNIAGSPLSLVLNGATAPRVNLNSNRSNGQGVVYNVQSNVSLAAGTLFTGNGTATFNFSGIVSGTSGFSKTGTSTLTLSNASNDFTGGVTLSGGNLTGGGLALANVSALGSNAISVTGNSTISATSGTVSNTFNITDGVTLGLRAIGATGTTTTFSSAITGAVGITLVQGPVTSNIVNLSSTNNTFTGNLTLPTASGTNDFINFASIGDGGSIIFGRASWLANVRYTGAANLTLNTRNIALASTIGIAAGVDGSGNPSHMFENNGTGTVTINSAMGVTSTATSTIFFLGGSNAGNNTFAGAIADPTGANTLGIGKSGAGKWILSNSANSYEGNVLVHQGTLSVSDIDVAANAQSLGKGSLIQLGYRTSQTSGTLEYTGSANATTDKQIQVGFLANSTNTNFAAGGVILNNGLGTLTFSNTTFNSIAGVPGTSTVDRTLTLGGSNTGANTISGTIQDNLLGAAQVSVSKTDAGTWVLGGANSYTGTTSVTGGTLLINGSTSSTSLVTVGASGTLGGNGVVGGNTTVNGSLRPGNSPGVLEFGANLTLGSTSISTMEIGGITRDTQYDGVNVAGAMAYGGTLSIDLTTLFGGGSYTFDLFNLTNAPTGNFTAVNLTGSYTGTLTNNLGVWTTTTNSANESWTFTQSTGDLSLVVIPEPSAALLGALGALALLRRRR